LLIVLLAARAGEQVALRLLGHGPAGPPTPAPTLATSLTALASATPNDRAVIVGCVIVAEAVALAAAGWAAYQVAQAIGPSGFASTPQARHVLGLGRLRRHRSIIRPDLHHRSRTTPTGNGHDDPPSS